MSRGCSLRPQMSWPEGKDNLYGYGALNLTQALRSINAPEGLYPPDLLDVRLNSG